MTVDMSDFDKAIERYEGALQKSQEIAKRMLEEGLSIEIIQKTTGLSEKEILELK